MTKIYFKQLLVTVLLLCSTVASAEDVLIDGINYYIDTNSNTATVITGSEKYTGDIDIPAEIVYNGTICSVTAIGSSAFYECRDITSITIPNSVTSIEHSAFSHCSGLTNITIPDNVASIGDYAFDGCYGLKNIEMPNSLKTINHWAFNYCSNLTSVTIPNSITLIGHGAFYGCSGLASVTIPNGATSIGVQAFGLCSSLTSIEIPNSVTNIGVGAFHNCKGLTSIIVEEGNAVYDSRDNCNAIIETQTNTLITGCKSTIIPGNVTNIGEWAFDGCSGLKSIEIPGSVTSIKLGAFRGCSDLTSITVDSGNTVYDSRDNCNAIIETQTNTLITGCKSTIIPGNVTNIGEWAFRELTNLTSITIPNSVTSIGELVFYNCTNLTDVYCLATTVPSTSSDAFDYPNCKTATLHVPATAIESYRTTAPWSNFGTIVAIEGSEENKNLLDLGACGDNLTCAIDTVEKKLYINGTGDMYDFDYHNHAPWYNYSGEITSVSINDGVTTIGAYAFDGCYGLTSITIPNSVTTIGDHAFSGCTGLTSVTIPNSVTTIGNFAFGGCYGITSVTIGNGVTTIGDHAFYYCTGLTSITVEGGNTVYDSRENCNAIVETQTNTLIVGCKNTIIPNSVTTIGDYAFYDCTGLTNITIPNSVTTIGYGAFNDCTGLTSVTIPNSVTTIGSDAFYNCAGLISISVEKGNAVYDSRENCNAIIETQTNTLIAGCKNTIIPNSVTTIGRSAFSGCSGLTSVTIPNSVTTIGNFAFSDCTDLTSVTIPNSVTAIGNYAFFGCTGLTSVTIPNSVTTIGYWAFYKCTNLTDVYCHATTVPETRSDAFNHSNATNATLHVPATAIESYRATAPWSNFGTIVAIEGSEEDGDEPSITTGEAIDLGLPSGIKWASCNIGATAPEEYGGYYAWGETEEKDSYDWSTYKWCNGTKYSMTKYCTNSNYGTVDNKTTLDPEDDVAHVKWGGNWRMPTLTEQQELIDNCVWVWTTINDVIGYNVTGPNGNSIFLPAAGFRSQKATKTQGSAAHYWTGSLNDDNSSAFTFYFYNKGHRCISNYRDRGHTVRPVYDDGSSTSIEIITPEVNNENTIYDLRGQKLTEITAPGIYIVNGKKVIVK